jgi:hypothetical protein
LPPLEVFESHCIYDGDRHFSQLIRSVSASLRTPVSRAKMLRNHERVTHVLMNQDGDGYVVSYSIAKWYFDEAERARISV